MRFLSMFSLALLVLSCTHSPAPKGGGEPIMKSKDNADNPFLRKFDTPFGVPPFDKIEPAHFMPAFEEGMSRQAAEIAAIVDSPDAPTFENTLVAMDRSGGMLHLVNLVFFGLANAHTNDALNEISKQVAPKLSKHADDIRLNEKLFARIKAIYEKKASLSLNPQQVTLLEEFYTEFVRGGAELDGAKKAELRKINQELASIKVQFGQNVLAEDNGYSLIINDKADLAGLPERVIQAAAKVAEERKLSGKWVFTLHKPSLIPFLQYADRRELRQKMLEAYTSRGDHGNEHDNKAILQKIASLRIKKVKLLGFKTFADFALVQRMAKTPKAAYDLIGQLWKAALPVATAEAQALQALIDQEGGKSKLEAWDWWYYAEKLRKAKYDLDENELRPYFKLQNVLEGVFTVAGKLYGLKFKLRTDLPIYHPEVNTYEVVEADGSHLGILYVDYFPRPSKRGGAWCGGFREQSRLDGKRVAPVITNVGNFTKPTDDKPALLSFEEVETLFHEFGHALHMLLSDTDYVSLGDKIKVDFVELPSQIMENWASEPEVLKMYARHFETNEPIPDALIEKIEKSKFFNQGFDTVEYLAACFLDMDWHMLESTEGLQVEKFEQASMGKIGLIPEIIVRYRSPYFQHIFRSDFYAAGYYSYIWSAVLDADAFEAFKEKGLFDQATAAKFRTLLERGGAEDPAKLYRDFRGADAKIEPLLKRRGMLSDGK